jgi:hypothetical protein
VQLGRHLHELWGLRRGVAVGALIATLIAMWTLYDIRLWPPALQSRALEMGTASTRVLVDTPRSLVLDLSVQTGDMDALTNRALLVGNVMASSPVRAYIARRAGVPVTRLKVSSPITRQWPRPLAQSGEKKSTRDILNSPSEDRLSLKVNPTVPVIDIFAQGATAEAAEALANGAVIGMRDYLEALAARQGTAADQQVKLQQLGRAKGSVINQGVSATIALFAFLIVFALSCGAVLFLARVRRGWMIEAAQTRSPARPSGSATI